MKKSKDMCSGCYNNDYNFGLGGSKECWSYKNAKVIPRLSIPINQMPPYDRKLAKPMMDCFNRKQMCYPSPEALTQEGFWK